MHFVQRHLHVRQRLAIELLEAGAQLSQAAVQVVCDALQRQFADAFHHPLQLFLQLLQAAGQGGDGDRVCGLVEGHLGGIGVEVQGNEHLPGDQVAAARLGPQPVLDEGADQPARTVHVAFGVLEHGQHLAVHRPQPLRVDHRIDHHREGLPGGIVVELDRSDPAKLHTLELHRRSHRQAAHGLVEAQLQVLRLATGRCQGGVAVGKQLEARLVGSGLGLRGEVGRAKGQPAHQDRRQ
ncbi:hypothetical protein D3C79_567040 [compost metagenome]